MNRTGIILLVEDDKNIQRINHRILEREGFQVLCAGTLSEARELLQTHTPDVLVLDIMLPDGLLRKNPSHYFRASAVPDCAGRKE